MSPLALVGARAQHLFEGPANGQEGHGVVNPARSGRLVQATYRCVWKDRATVRCEPLNRRVARGVHRRRITDNAGRGMPFPTLEDLGS